MSTHSQPSAVRLEADAETVAEVVDRTKRGIVRIPVFQRGLRWSAEDVVDLYDSIYRGYPIGSFLLRKGKAEAARIQIGPLKIDAPETHEALWVIDGQQRLTALAAGMLRPLPVPKTPDDAFVVYFDAAKETFHAPPRDGNIPRTWVPVATLLDASALREWVFQWEHGKEASLRSVVFEAGSRLRQYRIPLYIVNTEDETLLKEIFYRTNNSGKSLKWDEVHDALFGHQGTCPSTLSDLADELMPMGMGRPEEQILLACLIAYQGLDVTRNVSEHYRRDPNFLRDVVREALPTLRRVFSFLQREAEIPHMRLLPRSSPMVVLTRFFRLFPEPNYRTLRLLVRWTWRTLLGAGLFNDRTLLRRGVSVIREGDEERSAQELLELVPRTLPAELQFRLPVRFDARAAASRLAILGMISLKPLHLDTGERIDIPEFVEHQETYRTVVPGTPPLVGSAANRILLPGAGLAQRELLEATALNQETVFHSHGISEHAAVALRKGDSNTFLQERAQAIESVVRQMSERLADWSGNDRPSLAYLLQQTEVEP